MQDKLYIKLATIAVLSLLLLLPLSMIESQITARSARQAAVLHNIAESAAGPQTLVGPVMALRYRERVARKSTDKQGEEYEIVDRIKILPPQKLAIDGEINTETRSRGLYQARLFHLSARLVGSIDIPAHLGIDSTRNLIDARAELVFGVADPRGVSNDPEVTINGKQYHFLPGTNNALAGQGVHLPLGMIDISGKQHYDFSLPLVLTGSERLAIAPTANATTVALKSNWPHPSFQGRFLPASRSVSGEGFDANWQISHLARNLDRALAAGTPGAVSETLDIGFVNPVNVYLKAERAVKYGVLFVVLTFAAFFLTEILRRLPIHPMQYLLVGLALAIFFLLLIALSEHFPFIAAYAISALACIVLIGAYLSGALGSRLRGGVFGAGIASLYGVLYGVLISEDNALLMGTLILFVALGATMLATRRFDWYRLSAPRIETGC
ncbi:MAG: inner membrane protein [Pseudomonadota bacterium]|nr:inner membrane protein [Pseudomonadota bacterium]MDQ5960781.1 inner membrane protein [Pseudomonadota bacterium]